MVNFAPLQLLKNADVYAPEHIGQQHVLVGAGTVLFVGNEEPSLDGLDVDVVDLAGNRLMPGMVDCHVHVTGGGGEAGAHTRAPSPMLTKYTLAGVTTVVGLLGTDDLTRTTSGLLTQVKALRNEGLSAYAWTGGYHIPPTTLTGSVRSDIVHLEEVIGFGELAISDHRSSQPTFDEFLRVASECHVAGLMTGKAGVLHIHMGDGNRGLDFVRRALSETELPPRTLHPTHVNRKRALFDEALDLVQSGVTIDITAFPDARAADDEVSAAQAVSEYLDARLPSHLLTVSSDGGGCLPHFDANGELLRMGFATSQAMADLVKQLLDSGRSLDDIAPLFTSNPAKYLRLDQKGSVAVGKDADFTILDQNNNVSDVMANGSWHVRNGEPVRTGTFE